MAINPDCYNDTIDIAHQLPLSPVGELGIYVAEAVGRMEETLTTIKMDILRMEQRIIALSLRVDQMDRPHVATSNYAGIRSMETPPWKTVPDTDRVDGVLPVLRHIIAEGKCTLDELKERVPPSMLELTEAGVMVLCANGEVESTCGGTMWGVCNTIPYPL